MVKLVSDIFIKYINKYQGIVMQEAHVHALSTPSPQNGTRLQLNGLYRQNDKK